jgi:hypothetical protein
MKTWTWRVVLPVLMVILSIGLSPWFFHGLLAHSLGLYLFVNCVNAVPFTVFNTIALYQMRHHVLIWGHRYWARSLFWEIQALVFLFWFWVGWKIDLRLAWRDSAPASALVEAVLALALSLLLFLQRPIPPAPGYAALYRSIVMLWAVALLAFAIFRAARLWSTQHAR